MSNVNAPPIYAPLIEDAGGKAALPWILFFNAIFNGDAGQVWTPNFVNLTEVGALTFKGVYYQIGQSLAYFRVDVIPASGANSTATAGTTYIDNFPLTFAGNGANLAVSGLLGGNSGMCDQASNRIYPPAWTSVTVPLTIIGIVEAS